MFRLSHDCSSLNSAVQRIADWHPVVAFVEQTDKIGPAALDLGQINRKHLAFVGLGLGVAPGAAEARDHWVAKSH